MFGWPGGCRLFGSGCPIKTVPEANGARMAGRSGGRGNLRLIPAGCLSATAAIAQSPGDAGHIAGACNGAKGPFLLVLTRGALNIRADSLS